MVFPVAPIFCFLYRPSFDNTTAYYTSYMFVLEKMNGTGEWKGGFRNGETIPAEKLRFRTDELLSPVAVGSAKKQN